MENAATLAQAPQLRQLLNVDAVTCLVTGIAFTTATGMLSTFLGLPAGLLFYAGLVLFPCAALMLIAARKPAKPLVWVVILGNFAWAIASIVVAFMFEPTTLGLAFTLAQAVLVAGLGALEWRALAQPIS
jgi:hypothetical protein